jgi:hypothetical protein
MKKLFTSIGLAALFTASSFGAQISTNATTADAGGSIFLLTTNRASVYSVELTATYPAFVRFFDQDVTTAPYYGTNYVTAAYAGVSQYNTNYVTSFIGQNGITNWYTNQGVYTYSTSVSAATNALSPGASFVVAGGTYAIYNTDALFVRGIVMHSTTNVSVVVNYRPGR